MYFVKTIKNILYSIHRFLLDFPRMQNFNTTPNESENHFQVKPFIIKNITI